MNRLAFALIVVFTGLLVSCSLLGGKLKPGDKIGDMQILDFCEGKVLYELCNDDQFTEGTCEIPASVTNLWISPGWTEDTQEQINAAWEGSKWEATIDERKIDLPAFGTYDFDKGDRKARTWNVCLSNLTAGEHVLSVHFYLENSIERGNHYMTLPFTVLAADPAKKP